MTRALVIGFGSAGQRHARLLAQLGAEVGVLSRRPAVHARTFGTIEDALKTFAPDYAIVANETSSHRASLLDLQEIGFSKPVLVEKPLWSSSERPLAKPLDRLYVGYNLRFHPGLQELRRALAGRRVLSAEIHCGSWLPDWRPGRDYRKTSSSLRASAGGALHDLSHELDYANWLFGPWRRVTALGGHLSALEIETDDVAMILAEMTNCPALSISLNTFERASRRGIIVNTGDDTFTLDLEVGTLRSAVKGPLAIAPFILDETYLAQHRAILNAETADLCDHQQGLAVVTLMAAVEQAIIGAAWVRNDLMGDAA